MVLLSMRARKFYQRTGRKIIIDGSSTVGYDLMLWGDLHTLFEPNEEDEIWKNQHEYNVINWKEEIQANMALMAFPPDSEEIALLKRSVGHKEYLIGLLRTELEKVKEENEGFEFKIAKFEKSSKDLDQLLENSKQPEVNKYGPRDSSVKPTTGCDKESENSKENTDDSLKQKTDSSSDKSPLKISKTLMEDMLLLVEEQMEAELLAKAEAVSTACYVQNRVLIVKPHNKTPYELFRGIKPAIGFMKPFGCHVTILNTLDKLGKFDGKSDEVSLFDYSLCIQGVSESSTSSQQDQDWIAMPIWKDASYFGDASPNIVDDAQIEDKDELHDEDDATEESHDGSNLQNNEAMQEELLQFKLQKVWILVDLPKGHREIGTKWVYRNKKDEKGIFIRNKARLVSAQEHTTRRRHRLYDESLHCG
ncbi:retrovirus-related pol polyprotein from transposon TNT 1-94 [Tanacetum coccineum]